jgi:hypothetical protein
VGFRRGVEFHRRDGGGITPAILGGCGWCTSMIMFSMLGLFPRFLGLGAGNRVGMRWLSVMRSPIIG